MKVAVIFDNFGPYHYARLNAAASIFELVAVEVAANSGEYAWKREGQSQRSEIIREEWAMVTLLDGGTSRGISHLELSARLERALDDFRPPVVFIPGWSGKSAFAALRWCLRHKVPAAAMSESTEWDEMRSVPKEWVKRQIVALCSAALAGGTPQEDYLVKLGMPRDRIFQGYDVVDNDYFSARAEQVRKQKAEIGNLKSHVGNPSSNLRPPSSVFRPPPSALCSLPSSPYFLASARFIEKKNLPRLIQAYALYREKAEKLKPETLKSDNAESLVSSPVVPWSLVLLGDGELRSSLKSQVSSLNLHDHVQMPGFKQYPDLPAYYGLAGAFIHTSTTEQWGLVVNEAMASSLPVLVSNRCGCAQDLVQEGVNGFTFDPYNVEQLAELMWRAWSMEDGARSKMGGASRLIIREWGPERFGQGLKAAAECALQVGAAKPTSLQRMILKCLLWR